MLKEVMGSMASGGGKGESEVGFVGLGYGGGSKSDVGFQ